MDIKELLNASSFEGQFPIQFRNGYKVDTLSFWCPACNRFTPLGRVKGYISRIIESVADIRAATICPCGEVTRYQIRLRDDNTYSYLKGSDWVTENISEPQKNGIFDRVLLKFQLCLLKWKCFKLVRNLKKLITALKDGRELRWGLWVYSQVDCMEVLLAMDGATTSWIQALTDCLWILRLSLRQVGRRICEKF